MFDFIKKLFSGIAAFFGGLLGGKKSQDNTLAAAKTPDDASTTPKAKKSKGYYLELDETGNAKTETQAKQPEPAKTTVATAESPKAEPAPKAEKPEPVATPAVSQNGKVAEVKVEAQPNPPVAAASNGKVSAQDELTFAPKYLVPTATNSRRRPGPSMDVFRDMARQVKTPN